MDIDLASRGYGAVLWEPDDQTIREARITQFMRWLAARGHHFAGYDDLWQWSVRHPERFWAALWDYFEVLGERGEGAVLAGDVMPDVRWFEGATLNYARNALRTAWTDPDRTAIIFDSERARAGRLSYQELAQQVARVARGLRSLGVGRGDRVAALLPNVPEAVIGLLAAASLGAIWSSCSPDFGARSVIDRFAQIEPKVLIACDGYSYGGKEFSRAGLVDDVASALPGLSAVVLVSLLGAAVPASLPRVARWDDLGAGADPREPEFEEVPFAHPLWVVYSSGTTGLPKPIMHGHGGIVLEHLKALGFHQDLRPGDVFSWYTTTGWMMWNYLAGGLLAGVTIVLYDGSATYPAADRLWRLAAEHGLTYLGVGAPYLVACMKAGLQPGESHDLSALRAVGSTGSPLPPEAFGWVYEQVGQDLLLGSFSGGTDLCTGFVGPCPLLPVRAGIISGRCLAAAVEAYDDDGKPVVGEVGELVITQPMPSMPVGFWNDPGGARYRESYFETYPGVWRHGDWIELLPDGGCVIFGRSDATLNRGGVRMGTSEFYRVVEGFPEIADSLVVDTGQLGAEGRLIVYVVPAAGCVLDDDLAGRLRAALRSQLSPRHVPDEIHQVPGIPRTLSGKKLEVPVRKILLGADPERAADPSALANPEVLRYFGTDPPRLTVPQPDQHSTNHKGVDAMPETAADKAREALLAKAEQAWQDDPALDSALGSQSDSVLCYLRAYYQRVATEDLALPSRLAAVAEAHARLGQSRPQGRAVVQVRDPDHAHLEPVTASSLVVDIVTDDMPYLVDSVTTELNRHDAEIQILVHPLLRVRRDVTGALREVVGVCGDDAPSAAPDELTESWIHVELGASKDRVSADQLAAELRHVLFDVRVAVEDQQRMASVARRLADDLGGAPGSDEAEYGDLLRWLASDNFLFLGYREYDLVQVDAGVGLRAVPGTGLGILRHHRKGRDSQSKLSSRVAARAQDPRERLVLAKANSRSTVYRANYLDYVSVKKRDPAGQVTGEFRFLGLYTHSAHTAPIADIPVIRGKLAQVLAAAGLARDSHDGKDLVEILEDYPREELFEISAEELTPIALGVLRLSERKQTRLFLRRDRYGRYMSCLVYLPRDRYTTKVRQRAQDILSEALHGVSLDYSAVVGDSALARLHVVIRAARGQPVPQVDAVALERRLSAAVRSWDEDLTAEATRALGEERADQLLDMFAGTIPETYKADVTAKDAVGDLVTVLELREAAAKFAVRLVDSQDRWTLLVYRLGTPITLSDVLPQLQHMGLEVVDEHPYEFTGAEDTGSFWIYEFGLRPPVTTPADSVRRIFEEALAALWHGQTEDDGFNALVLTAGLSWREVTLLRACAKYLRQAGMRFSQDYVQRVLRSNAAITRLLVRLFESRFDPARQVGAAERCEAIAEEIRGQLDEVVSLDHDRILRQYLALVDATLRTNYYRQHSPGGVDGPPYLVLKLDPRAVPGLTEPRPKFEIYVYSPRLEAVHLRFGRVARGGLRWSDRLEDFRTEVLGLVKAQEVKNAVIVPSGAKGGFVCKRLPDPSDRDAYQAEVLACYQTFIAAMLDVTDNIEADQVVPPPEVVRRDGTDPYLVVAADKGTATFSDTANEVAARYDFWLGDAFASGGSEGFDHKKMGITARGAWESVKCHFAALGMNPATDEFTVAGIGDMSGDVFGNGMLLSEHIKLVAAFDHRHVFVDPDPDPAASFAERDRIFALPASSWADYDRALISPGGGVWPRSAKSVPLSPQARTALGIDAGVVALSPDELISAILAAPVDLLWNGGIGTYVKASSESQADAGDRSNDAVRIDATRLRARVVVEGGNLGLTQAARIEYSLGGGLVNTDFIDNSAGVDTSDHEVNIKILLADAIRAGAIPATARHQLLNEMTDDVADLVLRHNYRQNMALAAARVQAPSLLHVHARYLRKLVRDKRLDPEQDVLPGEREIAERRSSGGGLTSPEFALLLAQTKISAGEEVLASSLPDDPYLRRVLEAYFPAPLRARFAERMESHPLRREIITTSAVNEMIDASGTTFLFRLIEETGASVPDLTRAWLVAREVFDMPAFWRQVEELDGHVSLGAQLMLLLEGRKLTERAARWLLHNRRPPFDIEATVGFFADGVRTVRSGLPKLLTGRDLSGFEERRDSYLALGVPLDLAERVAAMVPTYSAFDIVQVASVTGRSIEETAEVYFDLADRLQITRLRDRITALPREDRWSTMARAALRDDLYAAHASLTQDVLGVSGSSLPRTPEERLAAWVSRNEAAVAMAAQTLGEIWESERFTFTTLSVALRAIRTLVATSSLPDR